MLKPLLIDDQLQELKNRALDDRSRVATGWNQLDSLLHRGGFGPGELIILAGRTRTRKSTLVSNLVVNFLRSGTPCAFVALEEATAMYLFKILSAMSGKTAEEIEVNWNEPEIQEVVGQYRDAATNLFTISSGVRPTAQDLSSFLAAASVGNKSPEVVLIDYSSLLHRNSYDGGEGQRILRLLEELQVFASENEVATLTLHQVNRLDEYSSKRYHGDTPLTLEGLAWSGEQIADVVLGSFRPSLDPLGQMTWEQAEAALGESFDEEKWLEAAARVQREKNNTYLQLLKNRPGVETYEQGIKLVSQGKSQQLLPAGE